MTEAEVTEEALDVARPNKEARMKMKILRTKIVR